MLLFSGYKIDDQIDENSLNSIIKKLYETSFFEKITRFFHIYTVNEHFHKYFVFY